MKEFFEREEIEEPRDPKMREVHQYLAEYQRQTALQTLKIYGPIFAAFIASAVITKSCDNVKQNEPAQNNQDNSAQTVSK